MHLARHLTWISSLSLITAIPASSLIISERARTPKNVIQNGDFETGDLAPWVRAEIQPAKSQVYLGSPGVPFSDYGAYLIPPKPSSPQAASVIAAIQQDVPLVAGKKYFLYYRFHVLESVPSLSNAYYVNPNGTITTIFSFKEDQPNNQPSVSYAASGFKLIAPADNGTLLFEFGTYAPYSRRQTFILDDAFFVTRRLKNGTRARTTLEYN